MHGRVEAKEGISRRIDHRNMLQPHNEENEFYATVDNSSKKYEKTINYFTNLFCKSQMTFVMFRKGDQGFDTDSFRALSSTGNKEP